MGVSHNDPSTGDWCTAQDNSSGLDVALVTLNFNVNLLVALQDEKFVTCEFKYLIAEEVGHKGVYKFL